MVSASHAINHLYSTDDDECAAVSGRCDHVCSNTNGSFTCSCHPGYFLDSDGKTCRGRSLQGCFIAVTFLFEEGVFPEKLGGVCGPLQKTLIPFTKTVFSLKIS